MTEIVRITERTEENIELLRTVQDAAWNGESFAYNGQNWMITSIQLIEANKTVLVEGDLLTCVN